MSTIKQLYQLQELEKEIDSLEKNIARLRAILSENEAVARAEAVLKHKQENLEALKKLQRQLEWEVEDVRHKIDTGQKELYSGRTGNPKELVSRQQDIEGLRTRQGELEIKSLDLMEQIDNAVKEVSTADDALSSLRKEKGVANVQAQKEIDELSANLGSVKGQREKLVSTIPTQATQQYASVKKQRGQAVVKIERGICGGCRISLPAREVQLARGNRLVCCSSCGRILFMP